MLWLDNYETQVTKKAAQHSKTGQAHFHLWA